MVAVGADVAEVRWLHVWAVNSYLKHCPDDYDHHDHRREAQESPDQKLKAAIIKFGEVVRLPYFRITPFTTTAHRTQNKSFLSSLPDCCLKNKLVSLPLPKVFV
jgi:hypothetical protein